MSFSEFEIRSFEMKMYSYIENYAGHWKNSVGNELHITIVNETTAHVSFFSGKQSKLLIRPWFDNRPAIDMKAYYDPGVGPDIEVKLGGTDSGFSYNLCFEHSVLVDGKEQDVLIPSIVRNETEDHLDQYYSLLGALENYVKCEKH